MSVQIEEKPDKKKPRENVDEGILEKILSRLGMGESEPQPNQGILTGISIESLLANVFTDKPRSVIAEKLHPETEKLVQAVEALARRIVDTYVADGLDRIMHPMYGGPIIDARLGELAQLLREAIKEEWHQVLNLIRSGAPEEEVSKQIREAELLTRISYLMIIELYIKLLTIYYINAPAKARPPLANVALGYELIK